jgi:hypothetical protein
MLKSDRTVGASMADASSCWLALLRVTDQDPGEGCTKDLPLYDHTVTPSQDHPSGWSEDGARWQAMLQILDPERPRARS